MNTIFPASWLNWRSPLATVLCLFSYAALANSQSIPADFRSLLSQKFKFTPKELQDAEAGQPVAKLITGSRPDDLQLVGVVRVNVSSDQFIRAFKDIVHFEIGKEVLRTGKFSDPPKESDLAGFHFPDLDEKKLLACHPGSCGYKLPASEMEDLQNNVNWSAPDKDAQLDARIRKTWIDYLNRYRQHGNAALVVYYDTPEPFSVE